MEFNLASIRPGEGAMVTRIHTAEALTKRLREFGLVPGTQVVCRYRSPWKDVVALEVRGAVLALRTQDLTQIQGER